jgi:predicted ester cyclase
MNSTDLVRCFYELIWNRGDKAKIPELLHESFTFRGSLAQRKQGHDGFVEYVDFVKDALAEYRCEIQEIVCEGNKAFAKVSFSGVHRNEFLGYFPTFKRVEWLGAALFTFDGDKISDLWVLGDLDTLREQLSGATERTPRSN